MKRNARAVFQRPVRPVQMSRGTLDEPGRIVIAIQRRVGKTSAKGNISRVFTAADARVSEVAAVIEHALFGDVPTQEATRAVESRGVAGGAPRYVGPAETQDERESA